MRDCAVTSQVEDALVFTVLLVVAIAWRSTSGLAACSSKACDGAGEPSPSTSELQQQQPTPIAPVMIQLQNNTSKANKADMEATYALCALWETDSLAMPRGGDTTSLCREECNGEADVMHELHSSKVINDLNFIPFGIHTAVLEGLHDICAVMEAIQKRLARFEASASRWMGMLNTFCVHIKDIQHRVAELEAENEYLRLQLHLQAAPQQQPQNGGKVEAGLLMDASMLSGRLADQDAMPLQPGGDVDCARDSICKDLIRSQNRTAGTPDSPLPPALRLDSFDGVAASCSLMGRPSCMSPASRSGAPFAPLTPSGPEDEDEEEFEEDFEML